MSVQKCKGKALPAVGESKAIQFGHTLKVQ